MINPPNASPTIKNENAETSPWYSGDKNNKGIPKEYPNLSLTIRKKTIQNKFNFIDNFFNLIFFTLIYKYIFI